MVKITKDIAQCQQIVYPRLFTTLVGIFGEKSRCTEYTFVLLGFKVLATLWANIPFSKPEINQEDKIGFFTITYHYILGF